MPPATLPAPPEGSIQVVELDFGDRSERHIPVGEVRTSWERGLFCWIDADLEQARPQAEALLAELRVNAEAVEQALSTDYGGRHDFYPDCLHITLTAGRWEGDEFVPQHVEVLIGEQFFITLRVGTVEFIEQVRRHYSQDFARFAQTPSFLLYECWDHLISSYKRLMEGLDQRLEGMQGEIFGEVDDAIFTRGAELTRNLLGIRKTLLASREVLHDLATRRSDFVAESAQPFLDRLVTTLERLVADLTGEREMLAETLNLYMGMVSHRTNKVVNRLTILSTVFLPLSFLVSVYGTNFEIPEVGWKYGYIYLWTVSGIIAAGLLWWMKRRRWW